MFLDKSGNPKKGGNEMSTKRSTVFSATVPTSFQKNAKSNFSWYLNIPTYLIKSREIKEILYLYNTKNLATKDLGKSW